MSKVEASVKVDGQGVATIKWEPVDDQVLVIFPDGNGGVVDNWSVLKEQLDGGEATS